ncbi:MAG: OmpA family protein [Bacteroidota bacterium]
MPTLCAEAQIFNQKTRLGKEFNSEADELLPVFSPDGKTMYFIRGLYGKNIGGMAGGQDIWYSRLNKKGKWQPAKQMPAPINNFQDNAVFHVSAAGRMLYLDNSYTHNAKVMAPGISYSFNFAGTWNEPKVMKLHGFNPSNGFSGYCLGPDENVLFISCPKQSINKQDPNAKTVSAKTTDSNNLNNPAYNEDLFYSIKSDTGGYSIPKSLGSVINTPGIEFSPWMDPDGITLYFASTGHKGLGGADIFRTQRLDTTYNNWSTPVNLGPAVNTKGFDGYFRIAPNRQYAVFATDSATSNGLCDLFTLTVRDTAQIVKREKLDSLRNARRNNDYLPTVENSPPGYRRGVTLLKLIQAPENEIWHDCPDTTFVKNLLATVDSLKRENERLKIARVPGERSVEEKVMETRPESEKKTYSDHLVKSYPKVKGSFRVLFPFDKWNITKPSERILTELLEYLQVRPNAKLFLYGHTDSIGSAEVNDRLSNRRAETIKAWLEEHGIAAARIRTLGKGMYAPVAANTTAYGRQQNRRTDVEIREQ